MEPHNASSPLTSVTVFHFTGASRFWAFAMMAIAPRLLRRVDGLRFSRMMGSGRGAGFTLRPDWGRYALLAVWETRDAFERFRTSSRFMQLYKRRSTKHSTLLLRTRSAHGGWDRTNPFLPAHPSQTTPLVILTRATIRLRALPAFWRSVPGVQQRLVEAEGLRGSIGIGERPFTRQATLSIWNDEESMAAFAYARDEKHRDVVRRTRDERWYREDLFARFDLVEEIGSFP